MNWYKGNIAEAVSLSKAKNAIFVVYVEGKDEATEKLTKFINEPRIRTKLESEDFVAIKIESESQAYMQFATIYQVVPVPSIFFIGRSGTPLEIGTGVLKTIEELEQKIDKVLAASGKSTTTLASASSTSFIAAEQRAKEVEAKTPEPVVTLPEEPEAKATEVNKPEQEQEMEVVCEGDVCFKRPKEIGEKSPELKVEEQPATTSAAAAATQQPKEPEDTEAKLEETRKKLEQQRRERLEAEQKLEKERELQRRRDGKEIQSLQEWQKEQELKELKETRRRERMEEQAARERIRAQIAADRQERARKFAMPGEQGSSNANSNNAAAASAKPQMAPLDADSTRLQFRFGSGQTAMHVFQCQDTLGMVRAYVRSELLPGTGIKDFTLATTYPKREFSVDDDEQTLAALALFPSAVILVIGRENSANPATIIARSGGLLNMLTAIFWSVVAPVVSTLRYCRNWFTGGNGGGGAQMEANTGANKRANEERETPHDVAKRRNLERFGGTGNATGTSGANSNAGDNNADGKPYRRYGGSNIHRIADNRKDSDDENATWNGNSTQQQ